MILDGSKFYQAQLWMLLGPALAIALITLAFTFVGDGLRDALDPRRADSWRCDSLRSEPAACTGRLARCRSIGTGTSKISSRPSISSICSPT